MVLFEYYTTWCMFQSKRLANVSVYNAVLWWALENSETEHAKTVERWKFKSCEEIKVAGVHVYENNRDVNLWIIRETCSWKRSKRSAWVLERSNDICVLQDLPYTWLVKSDWIFYRGKGCKSIQLKNTQQSAPCARARMWSTPCGCQTY